MTARTTRRRLTEGFASSQVVPHVEVERGAPDGGSCGSGRSAPVPGRCGGPLPRRAPRGAPRGQGSGRGRGTTVVPPDRARAEALVRPAVPSRQRLVVGIPARRGRVPAVLRGRHRSVRAPPAPTLGPGRG